MASHVVTKQKSEMMAAVRTKNTKPECQVRSELHKRGFRFRKNVETLPGKPDIVLPKYNVIIFINGCFWHGHRCPKGKMPKTNAEFWRKKIHDTQVRDNRNIHQLQEQGWRISVVWECSLKKAIQNETITALEQWISSKEKTLILPTPKDH